MVAIQKIEISEVVDFDFRFNFSFRCVVYNQNKLRSINGGFFAMVIFNLQVFEVAELDSVAYLRSNLLEVPSYGNQGFFKMVFDLCRLVKFCADKKFKTESQNRVQRL